MSRTTRPSDITRMRSQAASSSCSSDDRTSTALPSRARSRISVTISDFEPMSMPAVGSSRISTSGSVASHLAMTTFWALPPDSVRTAAPRESVLMRSRLIAASASPATRPPSTKPPFDTAPRFGRATLLSTEWKATKPWRARSSGTSAMPARIASRGLALDTGRPLTRMSPEVAGCTPQRSRASDERPEPSSPATPTTSPRCRVRSTSFGFVSPDRPRASSSASPIRAAPRATSEKPRERRPMMAAIMLSRVKSASGAVTTCLPSRRTVARSAMRKISSMRCDT